MKGPTRRSAAPSEIRPSSSPVGDRREVGGYRRFVLGLVLALTVLAAWEIVGTVVVPPIPEHSLKDLLFGNGVPPPAKPADAGLVPDAAAIERSRTQLTREPLDAQAYAVLALGAEQAGRADEALKLMKIAARWWPHDLLAQTWLMDQSLRAGNPADAMAHLDAIARGRPEAMDALTQTMAPIFSDPGVATALVDLLAARPPWRTRFLDTAVNQWRNPSGVIALMEDIQARPPGLEKPELQYFLTKLWATGNVDQAYVIWLKSLPETRLASLGYLYNGHFQYALSDVPFDWQTPSVSGTALSITGPDDQKVLSVGFLGDRVSLQPIQHGLVLAPGPYTLTGRVRTDRLQAERGIRWRLACTDQPDRAQGSSKSFSGTLPWQDFSADFEIPETSCRAQVLGLEVDARSASEHEASGVISFTQLGIKPR